MMPHEVQEVIAKVVFFLFATIVFCMTQTSAAELLF